MVIRYFLVFVVNRSSVVFSRFLYPEWGAYVTSIVTGACVSSWSSVTLGILWFIRPTVLMWGASSWCIAIATTAIFLPVMSDSWCFPGLGIAADVITQ